MIIKCWGSGPQPWRIVKRILSHSAAESRMWDWQDQQKRKEATMWTWDSARSPTTDLPGRQHAMPDIWGWTQVKSRFWKNMWILQSYPFPDQEIAPAGCIPCIDIRPTMCRQAKGPCLGAVSLHWMSRIMVQGAYVEIFPRNTPQALARYQSGDFPCWSFWHFLIFGFPPKKNFLSFYKPLLPTISCGKHFHSLTTYLMKNYLFFLNFVFNFPVCFILSCSCVGRK